ncbi:hypothetical protein AMECASPLE_030059 [Ameca splendens]|uniref:Uncharacterized protein n=1 Tax=Ameca splendens TaxID=208324 RepID=A0ABV0Y5W7_9TELE
MHTLIHTPKGNLERPIYLTGMFLGCGRKPEYPVRTHGGTGENMQTDMLKDPRLKVEPRILLAARQQCYQLHHQVLQPKYLVSFTPKFIYLCTFCEMINKQ